VDFPKCSEIKDNVPAVQEEATDDKHHALSSECTNADVNQIIEDRHDHAVKAL